ncbi:ABC-three component system protein [Clostridium fermenticellae]|uniref:ABC-three component system protein n=1 Tax=Clostridium fermenticellae TaxID=2068654 RepID=UPI003C12B8FD
MKIHEIMMNLDNRKAIDYEKVQDQMKSIYRRLKKANKSKLEIFTEISDKIHRVTLQDDIFCQIVVSYFIQSYEVF